MKKRIEKIKILTLLFCTIILAFQINSGFKELINIAETNQVYIQTGPVPTFDFELKRIDENQIQQSYVKTDTLVIYTYKMVHLFLLFLGLFGCLIGLVPSMKIRKYIQ